MFILHLSICLFFLEKKNHNMIVNNMWHITNSHFLSAHMQFSYGRNFLSIQFTINFLHINIIHTISFDKGLFTYYVIFFFKLTEGILRREAAIIGCDRRSQHPWGHRIPYSQPEAAKVPCAQRAQDFMSHRWLRNMWMFPYGCIIPIN